MKNALFMGQLVLKNQHPTARLCKTCGRKHARGNCLLVEVRPGVFRDIDTDRAINAHSG